MRIITGMHRSGTSLVARLFAEAGADLGDPELFYRGDRWNTDGYYEQPHVHAVNMPLINGWLGKLAYFHLPSTRTILRRARARADEIQEVARLYEGKVVKETRFCLTLPAWLEHGTRVSHLLVCLREPSEVAQSLRRRNKIPLSMGLGLWHEHLSRLLESAGDIPCWFIAYRNLFDPERALPELAAAFRFFGEEIEQEALVELCGATIKQEMNHARPLDVEYPPRVARLWSDVLARHGAQLGE
jgi:hypothetical protein